MSRKINFEKLMEPGKIGSVKTRNRIVKTGAGIMLWHDQETKMNKALLAYYESLARGGVGLLIVESPTIDFPKGARWHERYRLDDDKYIKGMSELVKVIKKYDCPAFMQMNHDGPWEVKLPIVEKPLFSGQPIAASAVSLDAENDFHHEVPKPLTIPEIERIIDKFAGAAVRASKAGFRGVDINAASSHLLHNFLSPFWNRREDKYGGNVDNRARIVAQIIEEIKSRIGRDFAVSVCINGLEIGKGAGIENIECMTAEYSIEVAKILEKAGADSIHVRSHVLGYHVGAYLPDVLHYPELPIPKNDFPREYDTKHHGTGVNVNIAAGIRKNINIPVIVIGKLDPILGEKILEQGKVDFVGMNRRLQADPELPNKIASGRYEDIAPCTGCENCLGSKRCRINAFLGKEYNTIEKARTEKNVVVIGGGPGGMEAARVVALRGHRVTLFEKEKKLGGSLPMAATIKGLDLEDLPSITRYYTKQLNDLGVSLRLGREALPSDIEALEPDAVVLATGNVPTIEDIPGVEKSIVLKRENLYKMLKFFLRYFKPQTLNSLSKLYLPFAMGKKVIIIGGGLQGCELAEFLVKKGRKVTIIDREEVMGTGMVDVLLAYLIGWFRKKGVEMISGVREYVEITDKGMLIVNKNKEKQFIEADAIIPVFPLAPNTTLMKSLKGKVKELYSVGDCSDPQLIVDAIGTASVTARNI